MLKEGLNKLEFRNSNVGVIYARYLRCLYSLNINEVLENIIHHNGPRTFYLVESKGVVTVVEYRNMTIDPPLALLFYPFVDPSPMGMFTRELDRYNKDWFLVPYQ